MLKTSRAVGEKEKSTNFGHAKEKKEAVAILKLLQGLFRVYSWFTVCL